MRLETVAVIVLAFIPTLASADALSEGKLLLSRRNVKDAIPRLVEAARSDTTDESLYCLALAYELASDTAKAVESYREVVRRAGKRAREADHWLKSLEAAASEAAALERSRRELERPGVDRSQRVKEARDRSDEMTARLVEREREAKKADEERDAAVSNAEAAERLTTDADAALIAWRLEGRRAPAGHGRAKRLLGTLLMAAGGVGLGASAWYVKTSLIGNREIDDATYGWSTRLDFYAKWGEISNSRLPLTIPLGALATISGAVLFGFGESVKQEPDPDRAASVVKRAW